MSSGLTTAAVTGTLAFLSALCLAGPAARVSLYQESRTTISNDNRVQTVVRKVWIKHPARVRMEETVGALSRVTVSNGTDLWIALPEQKKGQHRKLTPPMAKQMAKQLNVDLDMVPKFVKSGAKKVKQEKLNGTLCDVYQREKKGALTITLWVAATGQRLAQKQEESGIVRAAEGMGEPMKTHILKSTTDYLKWKIDQPISDAMFSPPSGVTYQELKSPAPPVGAVAKKR